MKNNIKIALAVTSIPFILDWSLYTVCATFLFFYYAISFLSSIRERIAFREFILLLYSLNYILSPALMYNGLEGVQYYKMKISEADYFNLAIPSMLLMHLGIYSIKTNIFVRDFSLSHLLMILNEALLKKWVIIGIGVSLVQTFLPPELAFFFYLLSMIRFVGVFGLLYINIKKYRWYIVGVFLYELSLSLVYGMFHDFVIWVIFLVMVAIFRYKPKFLTVVGLLAVNFVSIYLIQNVKFSYRNALLQGETAGFATFSESLNSLFDDKQSLQSDEKLAGSVTRINQAWILASTVDNMDQTQDFQNLQLVGRYAEAAFLPRFLAPNKLLAGDKEVFNTFSGHKISVGTSMGLGFWGDGYISFGLWGLYLFAYLLGLIFSLIFKLVEYWSEVSPFFIFFAFPILNYAVRPDCDTQTLMGHIVKSLFVFWLLVKFYRGEFQKKIVLLEPKETHISPQFSPS